MNRSKCHVFARPERSEQGKLRLFCYFFAIFSESVITFLYFCIQLLGDDVDQLSRNG